MGRPFYREDFLWGIPNDNKVKFCTKLNGVYVSGQINVIPKPELRGFWGSSLIKPPFRVTSAEVVMICPDVFS